MGDSKHAVVCGRTECPTCGHSTEAIIGPCADCCDYFQKHNRFPRRPQR